MWCVVRPFMLKEILYGIARDGGKKVVGNLDRSHNFTCAVKLILDVGVNGIVNVVADLDLSCV